MSSNQIFKTEINRYLLFELLDKISIKTDTFFIVNNDAFKKGMYNGDIQLFIEECKKYYHESKQKYLTRKINYNSFITVMRQICNFTKTVYTSKIKYEKSNYSIIYNVFFVE